MRKRRAEVGLGVAMLVLAALIAGGVLAPSNGILPRSFVPVAALVVVLGLAFAPTMSAERRLVVLLVMAAVVGSWATDVPLVKAIALAAGGLAILIIEWRVAGR
jgi:hypothetical protein